MSTPSEVLAGIPGVLRDGSKAPALGSVGWNHGKRLGQTLQLTVPTTELRLPLVYEHQPLWPTDVVLRDSASGRVLAASRLSTAPTSASVGWMQLTPTSGIHFPAGTYALELTPAALQTAPGGTPAIESFYFAPAWATDTAPSGPGGATVATYVTQPAVNATLPPGTTLASAGLTPRLVRAADYLLKHMLRSDNSTLGVFVIPDAGFRGAAAAGVNSGSSYYDLLRSGYKSSYINARTYQGLLAYADLQAAGLVPELAVEGGAVTAAEALGRDFVRQFVNTTTGAVAAWVACSTITGNVSTCNASATAAEDTAQSVVEYGFLPVHALAVQLGLDTPDGVVRTRMRQLRDEARVAPGLFRLNTVALESVSPRYWTSSGDWALVDADGFALRSYNQVCQLACWRQKEGRKGEQARAKERKRWKWGRRLMEING